jgi:hypothetical protein
VRLIKAGAVLIEWEEHDEARWIWTEFAAAPRPLSKLPPGTIFLENRVVNLY